MEDALSREQHPANLHYGMVWHSTSKQFFKHTIKQFDQCVGHEMETGLLLVIMEVFKMLRNNVLIDFYRLHKILAAKYE